MTTILIPGKFEATAKRIWTGVASQDELNELGETEVLAIKSDLEHMRIRYVPTAGGRATKAGKAGEDTTRSVDHVASDETPDRMGDIIRVAGWDLANFKSNPMLLWMHDHNHPIGRVTSAKKGKTDAGMRSLLTTSRIHEDEKSIGGLSNEVLLKLVQDGDLPAVSVGFQPLASHRPESEDERVKLGLGPWGVVYEASDLLELSVVSIGANPNALKRSLDAAVAAKRLAERDFDAILAEIAKAFDGTTRVRTVHALGGLELAARRALAQSDGGFEFEAKSEPAAQPEPAPEAKSEAPAASESDPAQPAMERLAALVERLDGTLRANAEAQTKLGGVLATLSTRLDEISRAAGAVATEPEAAPSDGSPAGAGPSPESRSASSEDFYATVLEQAVKAVRAGLAKKN